MNRPETLSIATSSLTVSELVRLLETRWTLVKSNPDVTVLSRNILSVSQVERREYSLASMTIDDFNEMAQHGWKAIKQDKHKDIVVFEHRGAP